MLKVIQTQSDQEEQQAHPEYSRIICAAVINKGFRDQLLKDPTQAVARGFNGESFQLSPNEKQIISSLKGLSLADFAAQLAQS
jgi:hypothetical protein